MHPTVRQATAADAPRVARLLIDSRAAFMAYAPSVRRDDEIHAWVARVLIPSGGALVADLQGSVVAALHIERRGAASWITQMAVDPTCVGKGIGSLLLAHALRITPLPIRLHTFQANQGARRFYERRGFVPIAFTNGEGNEERCPDVLYELEDLR